MKQMKMEKQWKVGWMLRIWNQSMTLNNRLRLTVKGISVATTLISCLLAKNCSQLQQNHLGCRSSLTALFHCSQNLTFDIPPKHVIQASI